MTTASYVQNVDIAVRMAYASTAFGSSIASVLVIIARSEASTAAPTALIGVKNTAKIGLRTTSRGN